AAGSAAAHCRLISVSNHREGPFAPSAPPVRFGLPAPHAGPFHPHLPIRGLPYVHFTGHHKKYALGFHMPWHHIAPNSHPEGTRASSNGQQDHVTTPKLTDMSAMHGSIVRNGSRIIPTPTLVPLGGCEKDGLARGRLGIVKGSHCAHKQSQQVCSASPPMVPPRIRHLDPAPAPGSRMPRLCAEEKAPADNTIITTTQMVDQRVSTEIASCLVHPVVQSMSRLASRATQSQHPPTAPPPIDPTTTITTTTAKDKVIFLDLDDTLIPSHYVESLGVHRLLCEYVDNGGASGGRATFGGGQGERGRVDEIIRVFEETGREAAKVVQTCKEAGWDPILIINGSQRWLDATLQPGAFERLSRALADNNVPVVSARQRARDRLIRPHMDAPTQTKHDKEGHQEVSKTIALLEEVGKRPGITHVATVGDNVWDLMPVDEIKRRRPDVSACKIRMAHRLGPTPFINQLRCLNEALPAILSATEEGRTPTDHNYVLRPVGPGSGGEFEAHREVDGVAPGHQEYVACLRKHRPNRLDYTCLDEYMDLNAPPDHHPLPPTDPHKPPTCGKLVKRALATHTHRMSRGGSAWPMRTTNNGVTGRPPSTRPSRHSSAKKGLRASATRASAEAQSLWDWLGRGVGVPVGAGRLTAESACPVKTPTDPPRPPRWRRAVPSATLVALLRCMSTTRWCTWACSSNDMPQPQPQQGSCRTGGHWPPWETTPTG
ncbi:unnamed protein product, partial [Vitrella brassicaformis CCMP3155]